MGEREITEFLTHRAVSENVSSSTQNQALCAILFLYREVLQEDIGWLDDIERAKRYKRLPVVFTREEAKKILLRIEKRHHIDESVSQRALKECFF